MTRKLDYGILNEIHALEEDYLEHDYIRFKDQKRGHGTSRNFKVMVKLHIEFLTWLSGKRKVHVIRTCLIPHSFIFAAT